MPGHRESPAAQGLEHRQEPAPRLCQRIDPKPVVMGNHADLFELREPPGENAGRDAGHAGADHLEPFRREHQLAHHQQGPPIPDQVQGMGGKASFVIAQSGGFRRFSHI